MTAMAYNRTVIYTNGCVPVHIFKNDISCSVRGRNIVINLVDPDEFIVIIRIDVLTDEPVVCFCIILNTIPVDITEKMYNFILVVCKRQGSIPFESGFSSTGIIDRIKKSRHDDQGHI